MAFNWGEERHASFSYRDGRTVREYRHSAYVTAPAGAMLPLIFSQLPVIGSRYDYDPEAGLASIEVEKPGKAEAGKYLFRCWLNYTTERTPCTNPLEEPAEIEWSTEQRQEWLTEDAELFVPILNSAGDPFLDPPLETTRTVYRVTIKKNLAEPWPQLFTHLNAVNKEDWTVDGVVVPKRTARLLSVQIGPRQKREAEIGGVRTEVEYRPHTFVVEIDPEGQYVQVADRGLYEWKQVEGQWKRVKITDNDGTECATPQFLDGQGHRLPNPSPESVVWLSFAAYPLRDFNDIPVD